MAKYGEGDARWIVEERADGTNVNNWHWKEKDIAPWCRVRLGELFSGLQLVKDGPIEVECTGVTKVGGDAIINSRKNKLIPSYEIDFSVGWKAQIKDGSGAAVGEATGSLEFPYVAEENHDEEPEMRVVLPKEDPAAQQAKRAILGPGKKAALDAIATFVKEIHDGAPVKLSLKAEAAAANGGGGADAEARAAAAQAAKVQREEEARKAEAARKAREAEQRAKAEERAGVRSITLEESFYCSARDIFECLTETPRVCAFTRAPAQLEGRPGGRFEMFGGSVQGEFVELVPGELVRQKWRFSSWADGVFSDVEIRITESEPGSTKVALRQTGIPEGDRYGNGDTVRMVEEGWRGMVFSRIKAVFGYGA
ncbi:unnamed protein product [Pedinophyceae sp. YPF-701]|nr:unnamed protein product [Pedinophyceae sp. YPF-701]